MPFHELLQLRAAFTHNNFLAATAHARIFSPREAVDAGYLDEVVPPALLLWVNYGAGSGEASFVVIVPVLVMACGQLAGGLAWLVEAAPPAITMSRSAFMSTPALAAFLSSFFTATSG